MATVWAGANDIVGAIVATPAPTPESVAAAAVGAATAVAESIAALRREGVRNVVVLNLPSLDTVPLFTSAPAGAAALAGLGSDLFNDTLAGLIDGMERKKRHHPDRHRGPVRRPDRRPAEVRRRERDGALHHLGHVDLLARAGH